MKQSREMSEFCEKGRTRLKKCEERHKSCQREYNKLTADLYEAWAYVNLVERVWEGNVNQSHAQFYPIEDATKLIKNNPQLERCFEPAHYSLKEYRSLVSNDPDLEQRFDVSYVPPDRVILHAVLVTDSKQLFCLSVARLKKLVSSSQEVASIFGNFLECLQKEKRCRDKYDQARMCKLLKRRGEEWEAFTSDPEKWCKGKNLEPSDPYVFDQFITDLERTYELPQGSKAHDRLLDAMTKRKAAAKAIKKTAKQVVCQQEERVNKKEQLRQVSFMPADLAKVHGRTKMGKRQPHTPQSAPVILSGKLKKRRYNNGILRKSNKWLLSKGICKRYEKSKRHESAPLVRSGLLRIDPKGQITGRAKRICYVGANSPAFAEKHVMGKKINLNISQNRSKLTRAVDPRVVSPRNPFVATQDPSTPKFVL